MNWSWLWNLFFWLPYKTYALKVTISDESHRKSKRLYFRVEKSRHRQR